MKRLFVAAVLLGVSTIAAAGQEGGFNVEGTNLDGSPYGGTATITWTTDTTCAISWQTGDTTSDGVCMRYGPAFAAFYGMDDGSFGLAIYQLLDTGVLEGIWTITGSDGAGTERLTPQ